MKILVAATDVDMCDNKGDAIHLRSIVERWAEDNELHLVSATPASACPPTVDLSITSEQSLLWDYANEAVPTYAIHFLDGAISTARLCTRNEYDFAYLRHDLVGSSVLGSLPLSCPLLVELNASLVDEHLLRGSISKQTALVLRQYEKVVLSRADRIISVSPRLATQLTARGIDRDKITVIGNGCDPEQFTPRSNAKECLGWDESRPHVGFLGNLTKWQGLDQLLASFPSVLDTEPRCHLHLVGDGPQYDTLERSVRERGLSDSVEFVGPVPHEQVPLYMSGFDVGVVLKHPEIPGSPLKLYEYLACGTPVLVTDDEDFAWLAGTDASQLVDYDSPEDITHGILALLEADSARLERTARALALDHTWDQVAKDVLDVAVHCRNTVTEV